MFQPIRMYHVVISTYSTTVSWSCDKSWLSVHIMWSIPQSRDNEDRKLKAIKYSIHDSLKDATCKPANQPQSLRPEDMVLLRLSRWLSRTLYFIAFNFLLWMSRDWDTSHDVNGQSWLVTWSWDTRTISRYSHMIHSDWLKHRWAKG